MSRQVWTEDELRKLTELYPHRPTAEVAKALRRPVGPTYQKANNLGLCKTQECKDASNRGRSGPVATQFPKGHVPANKGLRRPGWHAGRMRETQFQKGARSGAAARNWKPVGTIAADPEGYLRIKVREAVHGKEAYGFGNTKVWPLLNRYLWEQHHGPIPPKHLVVFKDRDRGNCVIENLELISRAENARRNRMWTALPRELAEAIQLNGVLKRKLRRLNG